MKRLNRKSCNLTILRVLWLPLLCLIGIIILLLFLFDSTFPVFKYSILCINIITYAILIASTIGLVILIKYWRKEFLDTISNYRKIFYSSLCIILFLFFFSSCEYLIYIHNQNSFNIENEYIQTSINDKISDVKKEINYCEAYMNDYIHILEELKNKKHIGYSSIDNSYFTIIHDDTIELKINKKRTIGAGSTGIYIDFGLDDARDIGISLRNELYKMSHPSSKAILESMKRNDSINVNDFRILINEKIDRYNNRIKEYKTILENELVITFGDFIIYNLCNSNITGNKTHIIIRLIFYLQAIVITFFSGYIYKTLYKMLDGKEHNN